MPIDKPGHHTRPTTERFRRPPRTSPSHTCASSRCAPPPTAGPRASAAQLCTNCVDLLRTDLRRLLDAYRESDHALTPAPARPRLRVSGTNTAKGILLDQKTMDLRTRMTETLASWARLIVDETRSPRPRQREVVTLVDFLCTHIQWLATHPAAADFDEEVRQLLKSCSTVLGPAPAQHIPIGICPQRNCHSTLHITAHPDTPAQHRRHITCDAGHPLPPHQWLHYMNNPTTPTAQNNTHSLTTTETPS
jgi:hypothetical protein